MNLRRFVLRTLAACAVLLVAILGYDGVRGTSKPAAKPIGQWEGRAIGETDGTSPFKTSGPWSVDVALEGDFSEVNLVTVQLPTRKGESASIVSVTPIRPADAPMTFTRRFEE